MLVAHNLSCRRGERLLWRGLSFRLEAGTLLQVRGRNGSGKTTLLRALCGLVPLETGEIRWRGEPIAALAEDYRRELVYFGHLDGIKGDLTAPENLRVAARLAAVRPHAAQLEAALMRLGLAGLEELPCRVLSQGQKKRVALARLLLIPAPLWILDEPFSALDTQAVTLLQELLAAHLAAGGGVILTTHQTVALPGASRHWLDLDSSAPGQVLC